MIRRDAVIDEGAPLHRFRGRMMYGRKGFRSTTYLFVTLVVYGSGIELRSTYSWLSRIVPIWRARYEELSVVQSVGRPDPDGGESAKAPLQARGVRFILNDGYLIFWCLNRDAVLAALSE
jgi:hypothetical protein